MRENVWKLPHAVKALGSAWGFIGKNKGWLLGVAGAASVAALIYFNKDRRNDTTLFQDALLQLNTVEEKAVTQMSRLQMVTSKPEAAKLLQDSTLPEWVAFKEQIQHTTDLQLDPKLEYKRQLLTEYAELRVQQSELLFKAFNEDTNAYDSELETVYNRINSILDELQVQD